MAGTGTKMSDPGGVHFTTGIATKMSIADITTPTEAELVSAFGAASSHGLDAGQCMLFVTNDNGANASYRLILCDGTKYSFSAALTVAS